MRKLIVVGAIWTAVAVTVMPWQADAQSRSSLGGSSSVGGVGGGTIGGGSSSRTLGNRSSVTLPAPAIRSGPPPARSSPLINRDYGMSGYYKNTIGSVPPATRANTAKQR